MAAVKDDPDAVWRALSDTSRRRMLDLMRQRPRTVGELGEAFAPGLSRFAVMKHLGVLKRAGLVVVREEGRKRWNHLNAVPLRRVYERWVGRYESAWAGALLGLERHVAAGAWPRSRGKGEAEMAGKSGEPEFGSFHIEQELELAAPRERVFAALLDVDGWWCHHFSKRKGRQVLEPFCGGRFYEQSPECEALFGIVTFIGKPETLRLEGPLGMGRLPVTSVYEFVLEERGAGTVLKLSHRCVGLLDPAWKEAHERGWRELWAHLKGLVESGTRYAG